MDKILPKLVILVLSLFSGFALLHKGFFPTHDGEYHIVRFYEFNKSLKDGQFYPRWQPDLNFGYGSPSLSYYYPLPNYLASILHLFGSSFIDAFQYELLAAVIIGSFFMYLLVKDLWGVEAGVISSVFYTYSPYHFVDIYVRGSVGEVLALAFFPGVLWAINKIIIKEKKDFIPLSSLLLALVIFSHNILAYMFFIFLILYSAFIIFIYRKNTKVKFKNLFVSFVLALGITAIFWIPALLEKNYVRGLEIFDYSNHFPDLYQLVIPSWGTGFSGAGLQNEMSFQLGIANLIAVFVAGLFLLLRETRELKSIVGFFVLSFFGSTFLMLKQSIFIWKLIPLFNYFQFPWRILSMSTLIMAILAGSIFASPFLVRHKTIKHMLVVFMIAISVSLGIGYMRPAYYFGRSDNYYFSKANFMDGTNTPGNTFNTFWFGAKPVRKEKKLDLLAGKAVVVSENIKSTTYRFSIDAKTDSKFRVNTAYFPNWTVRVDGVSQKVAPDKEGLFGFNLNKGNHQINISLEDTNVRKISSLISIIALLYILALLRPLVFAKIKR